MAKPDVETALDIITATFGCSPELAAVITAKARLVAYPPRAPMIEGGRPNSNVFLIVAGHAQAYALSIDARLVVIEDFFPGALFGETGLTTRDVGQPEVTAVTAVEAALFVNHIFLGLIETYGSVALAVSRLLTERLIGATQRMIAVTTLSAPGRIHAELHRQAAASGSWTVSPAPVLSEFALIVQSTRETVSRTINALEKRGIIARTAHGLTVMAPHRLAELIY